jgi:DNA-binding protein HU-beta
MNQSELILKTAQVSGVSKKDTEAVLKTAGDIIGAALVETGEAVLPGLGKLVTGQRAARTGRNPKTGEPVEIPASKTVKFKAAKALKDNLGGAA